MTWRMRSCRRCGGDTFIDKDLNNVWTQTCLQCGYDAVLREVDSKPLGIKPIVKTSIREAIRS